jgi:hypothetical protein
MLIELCPIHNCNPVVLAIQIIDSYLQRIRKADEHHNE